MIENWLNLGNFNDGLVEVCQCFEPFSFCFAKLEQIRIVGFTLSGQVSRCNVESDGVDSQDYQWVC